jgi:cyclophilin family peptidyl-prolyl cis-trans isomerase
MSLRSRMTEACDPALLESLETRLALYTSTFFDSLPALTDMQNQANTVVRLQTNQGNIDLELYDRGGPGGGSAAPITTANFLRYVNTGRYDLTFFHRLVANFVLQGGAYQFTDADSPPRYTAEPTFPAIQNEFNADRSNIERTMAMAKLGNSPNSATNQFFFNLKDNAHSINPQTQKDEGLDVQNGGFTVFAHVIKGWDVVTGIAQLQARDLNQFLSGIPNDQFGTVPMTGAGDTDLVVIEDVEIVKPAGSSQFFNQSVYYPEGFRSGHTDETIELFNQDPNAATPFQIIARFAGGARDTVIYTNTLAPGEHLEVPIARAGDPTVNKVRGGAAFAYEIRSARPVGATLIHRDSGATASEAFVASGPFNEQQLESWNFAHGLKGPGRPSYLVWENLTDQEATVSVLIYPDGGSSVFVSQKVAAHRRGGLNLNDLPSVPEGLFSVQVASSRPIVAALSQYSASPGRASTETGVMGGGSFEGVIPGAYIASGEQSIVSAMFTGSSPSVVLIDFSFVLSDGTVLAGGAPITLTPTISRRDVNLAFLNGSLPLDTFFTVRFKVRNNAAFVSVSYTGNTPDDTAATPFQTAGSGLSLLAGGFTDPTRTDEREFISIYNPFAGGVTATYRLKFHFTEGGSGEIIIPAGGTGSLAPSRRVDINVRDLTEVMGRIQSGTQFRHYSIEIETDFTQNSQSVTGALFVQLSRFDATTGTITTGPTIPTGQTPLLLSDPRFH